MLEKYIQRAIIEFLNYHGCWCWRNNAGVLPMESRGKKRMIKVGIAGESDIFGIHKDSGRFIAFEVKQPKTRNKVTQAQRDYLRMVALCNGYSGLITSPDEALAIIKRGKPGIAYGIDKDIPSVSDL